MFGRNKRIHFPVSDEMVHDYAYNPYIYIFVYIYNIYVQINICVYIYIYTVHTEYIWILFNSGTRKSQQPYIQHNILIIYEARAMLCPRSAFLPPYTIQAMIHDNSCFVADDMPQKL